MAKAKRYKEGSGGKLTQVSSSGKSLSQEKKNLPTAPIAYMNRETFDEGGDVSGYETTTIEGDPADNPKTSVKKYGNSGSSLAAFESDTGFSPTVFTNNSIIENVIPQLNARANSLPTYGSAGTDPALNAGYVGGDESSGDDFDIDAILGTKKKKKRKHSPEEYLTREGTNQALPSGYWEETYGVENAGTMKAIANMKRTSDQYFRSQLDSVENKYNRLQQMQQTANTQNLAQVANALNLGGSSRYAPLSSAGLTGAQQNFGIQKLAELADQEQMAIAEVRQAQQENDYELMEKKFDILDAVRKEKEEATTATNESLQAATRDTKLAGLVAQGITDPIELINYLNFDEAGNQIGDFTLEEVSKGLKNIGSKGTGLFSFDAKTTGPLLGAGFTMTDIEQMQSDLSSGASINDVLEGVPPEQAGAVRSALGMPEGTDTSGLTPGKGAVDSDTEYILRQRLFTSLKNQMFGKNSSDKEAAMLTGMIANLRDLGLGSQEIINQLTGFTPQVETPYNNMFANIVRANTDDPADISSHLQSLSSLLDAKDYKRAMQKVENIGMKNAASLDPDGYMGDTTAKTMLENARDLKDAIASAESYIGPFSGTYQQLLGKLKSGEAAKLKAKIVTLTAQFRNQLSGTAVTDSEKKFLEPLIADLQDTEVNFKAKLDELERGTLNKYNKTRETGALPVVSIQEALYPARRLGLYGEQVTSDDITTIEL